MHQLVRAHGLKRVLKDEGPSAMSALVVAELFYKFGSFLLECVAFLVTWYVFSLALSLLKRAKDRPRGQT